MMMSILLNFLTLKCDISRTIWGIEVSDGSLFCIFHALSFELYLFFDWTCTLSLCAKLSLQDGKETIQYCISPNRMQVLLKRPYDMFTDGQNIEKSCSLYHQCH